MKHLAQIQSEFVKHAADHQSWWEDMSNAEQKDYIQRHPGTKMRPTPEHSVGKREAPEQIDAKKKHVKSTLRELMRNPGMATIWDVPAGGDGWRLKNVEKIERHGPGPNDISSRLPGSHLIYNKDGKLFHETGKFDSNGHHVEHEVKPDEAASIMRDKLGLHEWDLEKKKEKALKKQPVVHQRRPLEPDNNAPPEKSQAEYMEDYAKEHAKRFGPNSSPWS